MLTLFYEVPPLSPYIAYYLLFQILVNPLPLTPTPTVLSVVLFLWLNGWSHHIWCAILHNDNMDLHMLSVGALLLEGPWYVFYATRHQVYWGLTHVVYYWYSDLIKHTHTKHIQHTNGLVDWHSHISICLHHLLCVHSSYLYYIKWLMNNSLISKIYSPQCLIFSKSIHL